MLEQASNSSCNLDEGWKNQIINEFNETQHHSEKEGLTNGIIETSYITLDEEQLPKNFDKEAGEDANAEAAVHLVRNSLLDALKVEVGRRLSTSYLKKIDGLLVDDMKQAVDTIAQAVVLDNQLNLKSFSEVSHSTLVKFGTLGGEHAVHIISSAIEKTSHLKKVLLVGVIVGSLLASLRKYFKIATSHDNKEDEKVENIQETSPVKEANSRSELFDDEKDQAHDGMVKGDKTFSKVNSNGDGVMIGAVTAALGATALFAHHQPSCERKGPSDGPPREFVSGKSRRKSSVGKGRLQKKGALGHAESREMARLEKTKGRKVCVGGAAGREGERELHSRIGSRKSSCTVEVGRTFWCCLFLHGSYGRLVQISELAFGPPAIIKWSILLTLEAIDGDVGNCKV
ncbi:hypothetical protein Cni_G06542 [Canna indica]|uniref:Uncharacterized protein n=1 Tax=Canna indica TaxID=4628 RepID=A0AAQ3JWS2_9LILI|nr:hypothetical protein Cni_G06542 [Canna indica]